MECPFRVDERIICINDRWGSRQFINYMSVRGFVFPKEKEIYTVRALIPYEFWDFGVPYQAIGVYLQEIVKPVMDWSDGQSSELPFLHTRFRPLDLLKQKPSIEVFNKLLTSTKIPERV
jgi:hypothetical protein